MKTTIKEPKEPKSRIYLMDLKYSSGAPAYNPEGIKQNKRTEYRYIVDGEGREKLMVTEIYDRKQYED